MFHFPTGIILVIDKFMEFQMIGIPFPIAIAGRGIYHFVPFAVRTILPTEAVDTAVMHLSQGNDVAVALRLSDTSVRVIGIIGIMLLGVENDTYASVLVQN